MVGLERQEACSSAQALLEDCPAWQIHLCSPVVNTSKLGSFIR